MKRVLTLAAAILLLAQGTAWAQQDAIMNHFGEYYNDEDFSKVYISKYMFAMMAQIPEGEDEEDIMQVIRKLNGLRLLRSNHRGGESMYQSALQTLGGTADYQELLSAQEEGEQFTFYIKEKGDHIGELLMVMFAEYEGNSRGSFIALSLTGDIDLEDIAKISKSMDINGLEKLEELEK